jgi:hypothetical protein
MGGSKSADKKAKITEKVGFLDMILGNTTPSIFVSLFIGTKSY